MLGADAQTLNVECTALTKTWARDGPELTRLISEKIEIMSGQKNLSCIASGKDERLD